MTAVESLTVTELDEQTRDELQPPCDARIKIVTDPPGEPCPNPSSWATRVRCTDTGAVWARLNCDEHVSKMLVGSVRCLPCHDRTGANHAVAIVSMERL